MTYAIVEKLKPSTLGDVCVCVCVCVDARACVTSLAALRVRLPICSGGLVVCLYNI